MKFIKKQNYKINYQIGAWCNGNTTVFGTVAGGSIPSVPATQVIYQAGLSSGSSTASFADSFALITNATTKATKIHIPIHKIINKVLTQDLCFFSSCCSGTSSGIACKFSELQFSLGIS